MFPSNVPDPVRPQRRSGMHGRARGISRLTGTSDTVEAGFRIIYWAAAYQDSKQLRRSSGFPALVREWVDSLVEFGNGYCSCFTDPLDWVRAALSSLWVSNAPKVVEIASKSVGGDAQAVCHSGIQDQQASVNVLLDDITAESSAATHDFRQDGKEAGGQPAAENEAGGQLVVENAAPTRACQPAGTEVREIKEYSEQPAETAPAIPTSEGCNPSQGCKPSENASPKAGSQLEADEDKPPADGPFPPDGFRFAGKETRVSRPKVWRLIRHLWEADNGTAEFSDLGEPVWQDHECTVDQGNLGSLRRDANHFFERNGWPFRVTLKNGYATLIDKRSAR